MTGYQFTPAHSLAECQQIITAPGAVFETEHVVIDGVLQRAFKNMLPSLRAFWLDCVQLYGPKTYLIFETERLTYDELHTRASRLASIFHNVYGIRKGDRVAIGMRNCVEWVVAFWACHLVGAVSAHVNAWLPAKPFVHCLTLISAKLVLVDPQRAKIIASHPHGKFRVLVARADGQTGAIKAPHGMDLYDDVFARYNGPAEAWRKEPDCVHDDNATIFFTSGTTGMPKAVLSTQRAFQTSWMITVIGRERLLLRRGLQPWGRGDPSTRNACLNGVPLFHVTGCANTLMSYTWQGWAVALIRKWDKDAAAALMLRENITAFVGVPSQVYDLADTPLAGRQFITQLAWGGAPSPATIIQTSARVFPGALMGQGYGLTETNAAIINIGADDYLVRPTSAGVASPVNDVVIMDTKTGKECPVGETGELWTRGPGVMREYWNDPEETKKALTPDRWFKTGDLAYKDAEGFYYLVDRVKDIIIRGGENIHSVTVENAIYADDRILEVAAVAVPDKRLGELPAVIVVPRPKFAGQVTEAEVLARATESLPHFAVPVMVMVSDTPLERNAAGKILKREVKKVVEAEWKRRTSAHPKAKL